MELQEREPHFYEIWHPTYWDSEGRTVAFVLGFPVLLTLLVGWLTS